jgi:hypothetical protein
MDVPSTTWGISSSGNPNPTPPPHKEPDLKPWHIIVFLILGATLILASLWSFISDRPLPEDESWTPRAANRSGI